MRLSVCRVSTVVCSVSSMSRTSTSSVKCEADEVFGIGLDEMFGDGIIFGHVRCLASDGVSKWDTPTFRHKANGRPTNGNSPKIERYFALEDV